MRKISCDRCGSTVDEPPKDRVPDYWEIVEMRAPLPIHCNREIRQFDLCQLCVAALRGFLNPPRSA